MSYEGAGPSTNSKAPVARTPSNLRFQRRTSERAFYEGALREGGMEYPGSGSSPWASSPDAAGRVSLGTSLGQTSRAQHIIKRVRQVEVGWLRMVTSTAVSRIRIRHSKAGGRPSSNINGSNISSSLSSSRHKCSRMRREGLLRRTGDHSQHDTTISHSSKDSICLNTSYRRRSQGWRGAERRTPYLSSMSMSVLRH